MRAKPFLKWAGGKYRLLDTILNVLPTGGRFVEPFAGSCAVYQNCNFSNALVCDLNADLIALYQHLQHEGDDFIAYCQSFFTLANNTKERYLNLRERFNASRNSRLRGALLLYLNRHAFNGLVRYNAKGGFNVPFGRYAKPYFPLGELRAFHRKTQEIKTEFVRADFRAVFAQLQADDVVYCDPPYVPLSKTANFTAYASGGFSPEDQQDLINLALAAQQKGIPVIVSNHDTEVTRALYAKAEIHQFQVRRFISCDRGNRARAPELLAIYR